MSDALDPDIRAFRDRILSDYARLGADGYRDLTHRRAVAEQVRAPWASGGPDMASTERLEVAGRRVVVHRPTTDPDLPVLVYLHGGGWVLFSIDTHDRLMREYAARAGCAVVGLDYSLSPEAPFPRALEEIDALLDWLAAEGPGLGLDPTRIALGGDSAGGNLALSAAIRRRDAGRPPLKGLLLNYGAFDSVRRGTHDLYGGDAYMLTPEEMLEFWADYAPTDPDHPHVRPLLADLAGLPPTCLCVAECDILADENLALADKLAGAGVPCVARVYEGASHSFLEAASISPLARRALDEASTWLRTTL